MLQEAKFDLQPIKDKFRAVQFSFYTQEEIEKMSACKITSTVAFDHMNNPMPGGLHDKALGVSPFDNLSICETCGLQQTKCPGHTGHIQLAAPIYNPFLFKEIYKLLKSKCFECHRLRIHPEKIDAYTTALQMLKAGELVGSGKIKQWGLTGSKNSNIMTNKDLNDDDKLLKWAAEVDALLGKKSKYNKSSDQDASDIKQKFTELDEQYQDRKEKYAESLFKLRDKVIKDAKNARKDASAANRDLRYEEFCSTIEKTILEMRKEIWSAVVTTVCPHCKYKSPAIKRDGYTKLFIKPIAAKSQNVNIQRARISSEQGNLRDGGLDDNDGTSTVTKHTTRNTVTSLDVKEGDGLSEGRGQTEATHEERSEISEEDEEETAAPISGKQEYIRPDKVLKHIEKLFDADAALLRLLYGRFDPQNKEAYLTDSQGYKQFFLNLVVVPPTRFRPESEGAIGGKGGQGSAYLHTHSTMLLKVIQTNSNLSRGITDSMKNEEEKAEDEEKGLKRYSSVSQQWIQLQDAVNCFMDSSMAQKSAEQDKQGVRQLLERKEGMFRMKMMGKRVDYGGRSVISPDPNITTDEIGVPIFMARKLTFPESVSNCNAERLAKMVRNGPTNHPGANMVLDEATGVKTLLSRMSEEQREGVARKLSVGNQVVYRHLSNGDPLLVNRQPTLHKPSIMAHVARVLPKEQTLRMHYANCSTYNADFDGDEMNIHLCQSYEARAEALNIMATHKQYVVPTSGKPIRGLIQDSVVSGVRLSNKDCFLPREEYMQLVYAGVRQLVEEGKLDRVKLMPPAMIKPKVLWTGKQVISTILKNIVLSRGEGSQNKPDCGMNLDSRSRLNAKEWGPLGKEEGEVIIRDNEHLQGTLDKNQFGNSDQGLVHCFYEIYGSKKAGELLTALARVFAVFLQQYGHTVGIDDLLLKRDANKKRRLNIENGHMQGVIAAATFAEAPEFNIQKLNYSNRVVFASKERKDKKVQEFTDMALPKDPFNPVKKCIQPDDKILNRLELKIGQCPSQMDKEAHDKHFDNIMKGKMSQVTSEILGDCIPGGLLKKFPKNNISTMVLTGAKGGLVNQTQISALLGQQELEGRRVPKMQNGKTLPSYLAYDPNPRANGYVSDRFITGLRPQDFFFHCMAGREGLIDTAVKTSRSGYLQRCLIKGLEALVVKYDMTVRDSDNSIVQFMYGEDGVDVMNTKFLDKFKFMENNFRSLDNKADSLIQKGVVCEKQVSKHKQKTHKKEKKLKKEQRKFKCQKTNDEIRNEASDPVLALFDPKRHIGAISESMENKLEAYIDSDLNFKHKALEALKSSKKPSMKFDPVDFDAFKKLYYYKYLKSVVDPGENVGTIAAQSIGEPSTQMTLNTFHLAGHGGANMTLGIPRLKEILMTTPYKIKTPCMQVYFKKDQKLSSEQMQQFAHSFERLKMSDVVKDIKLGQDKARGPDGKMCRTYKVTLDFESSNVLKKKLNLKFSHLARVFRDQFVPKLLQDTLLMIRKTAESDMTGDAGQFAANELKKVISVTTKATTVSRGAEKDADEQEDQPQIQESDEEDEKRSDDEMMGDTDGIQKSKKTTYDDDESIQDPIDNEQTGINPQESEAESQNSEPKDAVKGGKDTKKKDKDNLGKYAQYLKTKPEFEKDQSASVTLAFPIEFKKLLLLSIVENVLEKVLVRNIPGIERCNLIPASKPGAEPYLFVQGINFQVFESHPDKFDLKRIQTNHSYGLKERYGIEACRANIVKEIRSVFGVYGIDVDYRHLSLISDFITFNGDYRAFNRIGMEESSSPFLKMSFETTMKYLISSASNRDTDWITSPSSAIVVGQPPTVGSNTFDLIQESF